MEPNFPNTVTFSQKALAVYKGVDTFLEHLQAKENPEVHPDYHATQIMFSILENVVHSKKVVYMLGEKFGKHLNQTAVDVPCNHLLKSKKAMCIEFPESVRFEDEAGYYPCAMLSFGKARNTDDDLLMIAFPINEDFSSYETAQVDYFYMPIDVRFTIQNCVDDLEQYLGSRVNEKARKAIAFVAKCILYIESGNPDLVNDVRKNPVTTNPRKIRNHWKKYCPLDIVRVGYNFHHKVYHTDSTEVSGHFRWQPCGLNRQDIKLIWIKEHTRVYNG